MIKRCDMCSNISVEKCGVVMFGRDVTLYLCEEHLKHYGINGTKMPSTTHKPCSHCGEIKSVDDFYLYTDNRGVVRYRNECKVCNLVERKIVRIKKERKKTNGK